MRVTQVNRFLSCTELKEITLFNSVSVCFDSIEWANHLDLDPELLYQKSSGF